MISWSESNRCGSSNFQQGSEEKDVITIGFRYLTDDGCLGFGPMYAISDTCEQVTDQRCESQPCSGGTSGEGTPEVTD